MMKNVKDAFAYNETWLEIICDSNQLEAFCPILDCSSFN